MDMLVLVIAVFAVVLYMGLGGALRTVGGIASEKVEDAADQIYIKRMQGVKDIGLSEAELETAHSTITKLRANRRKMSGL